MPTYQYACTNPECGNRFELVQTFTDPSASECPVCGSPVRKVYSAVGVVFKGSGFYRNDSRSGSGSGSSEKTEKSEKSDKSEKKSDSATKSDSSGSSDSSSSSSSSSSSDKSSGSSAKKDAGSGSSNKAAAPA